MASITRVFSISLFFFHFLYAQGPNLNPEPWVKEVRNLDLVKKEKKIDILKEQKKKRFLKQFRRSDIIFFVSLPFTYLISYYLIAPQEIDYVNSFVATARGGDRRNMFLDPYENIFDSSIFFIWMNSIIWSATISFNDYYQNHGFERWNTDQKKFSKNQVEFSFYQARF